ncbi:MAG: multidrug efflux SMR transporter [Deltaproteobacteria bacterium]|nr:multidrug efflux SMR transporter [Candidatus Zymogenaceae bacterium]
MYWFYLLLAILTEVAGTVFLKLSDGMTKIVPIVLTFILYGVSFVFLGLCLKKIDVAVSYAIWSGLGTALITVVGFLYFKEPMSVLKVVSIGLIIVGVVGLNLTDTH